MRIVRTISTLNEAIAGRRPAFVPTMGALHAGHQALIRRAADERASPDLPVVVSIFVNPTQFGPSEDYTRYPRMLDADAQAAGSAGTDLVFAPVVEEVYPAGMQIPAPPLPAVATLPQLEDAHRPTHFAGVCQVVARLFDLVQPSIAIFGEKDFQQLRVIQAMVQQQGDRWGTNLRIIPHPTIRESDGLAMSSRNAYLSSEQRQCALGLKRALDAANDVNTDQAEARMRDVLEFHGLLIDYAVIRDADSLLPTNSLQRSKRALIAARIGNIRLIDNMAIDS
jgi:pantoate--beta-alanine ligase